MRKEIVIGSLLVVIIMLLLPTTSVAESNSAIERIQIQKAFLKEVQENIQPTGVEPSCILRLLLWLRNIIIIGTILVVFRIIRKLFNLSSISVSN